MISKWRICKCCKVSNLFFQFHCQIISSNLDFFLKLVDNENSSVILCDLLVNDMICFEAFKQNLPSSLQTYRLDVICFPSNSVQQNITVSMYKRMQARSLVFWIIKTWGVVGKYLFGQIWPTGLMFKTPCLRENVHLGWSKLDPCGHYLVDHQHGEYEILEWMG